MSRRPTIAITTGEPAGIGPEIATSLAMQDQAARVVLLGDRDLLKARMRSDGVRLCAYDAHAPAPAASLEVIHVPLAAPCTAGTPDPANAGYVLSLLERAASACVQGEFDAMVTAPIHKGIIRDAGHARFIGHTEYLAELTATAHVVMMLTGRCTSVAHDYMLRVALATTHLPLRDVPDAITAPSLEATLSVLHRDLQGKFGITSPNILVAGLNPHAGEGGHLGREELDVIAPVLDKLRAHGMRLLGPMPADTLFNPSMLAQADAVLAMYHDQGLPVLKHATFGHGVNITLGLPIIRTSVDHGTAFDLAGSDRADGGSLVAALALAAKLVRHRQHADARRSRS